MRSSAVVLALFGYSQVATAAPKVKFLDFTDDCVEIADSDALGLTGSTFSVSPWIRPAGWGENAQGRILDHGGGSSGSSGWSLHLESKSSQGYPEALRLQINNDSSFNGIAASGSIQLDVWQHVAATFDDGQLTLYVDALPVDQATGVPAPAAEPWVESAGADAFDPVWQPRRAQCAAA